MLKLFSKHIKFKSKEFFYMLLMSFILICIIYKKMFPVYVKTVHQNTKVHKAQAPDRANRKHPAFL